MNETFWVALLGIGYLLLLFAIAYATDKARESGHSLVDNLWVYSISLAVYCTSWTFYGSVGQAASTGLGFLPIYLGPTLIFLLGPSLLKRLVSFCRAEGVTSLPDLLEVVYGKGWALGALATTVMLVGITPYIGLQLKAVGYTFDLLTGRSAPSGVLGDASFWAALALSIFAGLFGARSLVASERHEGMVAAVVFESVVMLGVFLVLGLYISLPVADQCTRTTRSAGRETVWRRSCSGFLHDLPPFDTGTYRFGVSCFSGRFFRRHEHGHCRGGRTGNDDPSSSRRCDSWQAFLIPESG